MPDFSTEDNFAGLIAGVDEAGRGPWAGPVIAAAVIIDRRNVPEGINDSKKLSQKKREALFEKIYATAKVGVGVADVYEIDKLNILQASMMAMQRAVAELSEYPDIALIDGNKTPDLRCKTKTLVKGDSKSISIAAASIIAKVTRDRIMHSLSEEFPFYGWEKNAGYGTKLHQDGLAAHGVSPHHRRSFRPIAEIVKV